MVYDRSSPLMAIGSAVHGERGTALEAYCVKCREKREVKDPKAVTLKNGKPATQGICSVCGTKVMRIGKAVEAGS